MKNFNIHRTAEHTRAYIKVQDGCNQFCTYCIIPYARGRVRSRDKQSMWWRKYRHWQHAGYKEVVLTGIHLSFLWCGFSGRRRKKPFLSLILAVHADRRDPTDPPGVLGAWDRHRGVCTDFIWHFRKFVHIFIFPYKAAVMQRFKRMNRRYRSDEYRQKCKLLREYFSNPALTTDVIVGFPMRDRRRV